ncbi:MAG TPA: hypothetical protein VKQ36_16310 [Ktedonobacterales bacterium]|nr:hypothetical protein [Ktedonobacterales bacterium]
MARKVTRFRPAVPPPTDQLPLVNASAEVAAWLEHYWRKLRLPADQARYLGVTDDRQEFARWTGRRLNPMALGCYCYLPLTRDDLANQPPTQPNDAKGASGVSAASTAPTGPTTSPAASASLALRKGTQASLGETVSTGHMRGVQLALPGFGAEPEQAGQTDTLRIVGANPEMASHAAHDHAHVHATAAHDDEAEDDDEIVDFRHLIFVEPDLLPEGIEVTIAHELIHLADRVKGQPRKHHCHGHDAISVDEAAITGRDPAWLRDLLAEETRRREDVLRQARPYRYFYICAHCGKEYPRVRKYQHAVSCGHCDRRFNPAFLLRLRGE